MSHQAFRVWNAKQAVLGILLPDGDRSWNRIPESPRNVYPAPARRSRLAPVILPSGMTFRRSLISRRCFQIEWLDSVNRFEGFAIRF